MSIQEYLNDNGVFSPVDLRGMSMAFDDVCKALRLDDYALGKEAVAARIIELSRRGERSPTKLRDRVLAEAKGDTGC